MDDAHSAQRSISHENLFHPSSTRPPLPMESGAGHPPSAQNINNENRAPPALSTALNSMLKTTTETGDIGQFAVKNPRIPHRVQSPRKASGGRSDYTLQRPQHTFQLPTIAPASDDRRRLPSYARDATSEIVSLYQTGSQKSLGSRRVFEQADCRSCSMTQTSYSSHVLSNHRSYTSLRSQPELNLVPRPRSPFPYPARLKRLGFRPSSPILNDEGPIISNNRTENLRTPNRAGTSGSSSSSSYPYPRELLPPVYRLDANRSNSSLNFHTLPMQQPDLASRGSTTTSPQDLGNHPDSIARKVSPARSNFSSTSTTNLHHSRPAGSAVPTPGKLHTPSPLYYDYTEDFNVEDALHGDRPRILPAPPFVVNKGVLRDGVLSPVSPSLNSSTVRAHIGNPNAQESIIVVTRNACSAADAKSSLDMENDQIESSTNVTQDIIPLYFDRGPYVNVTPSKAINMASPRVGISNGSTHRREFSKADSMDGFSAQFIEFMAEDSPPSEETSPEAGSSEGSHHADKVEKETISNGGSSVRLSTYLPNFPNPPDQALLVDTEGASTARSRGVFTSKPNGLACTHDVQSHTIPPNTLSALQLPLIEDLVPVHAQFRESSPPTILKRAASAHDGRIRSSRFFSIDHGLTDLAQLITKFEAANYSFASTSSRPQIVENTQRPSRRPLHTLPPSIMLERPLEYPTNVTRYPTPCSANRILLNKSKSLGDLRTSQLRLGRPVTTPLPNVDLDLLNGPGGKAEGKSSRIIGHQNSQKSFTGSGLPMLAPLPISPVRILKLKNSIPQLMKALPPVPQSSISTASSPMRPSPSELPCRFPPVGQEQDSKPTGISMSQDIQHDFVLAESPVGPQVVNDLAESLPTPKFKLRSKLGSAQGSSSSPSSRPWNLDENYPWSSQQPSVRLASILSGEGQEEGTPRFKLRVTRASNLPSGTIRINSEARRRRVTSDLEIRQPKDLFTASSSLSEIFRQVGKHFSSRKNSVAGETITTGGTNVSFNVLGSTQVEISQGQTQDSGASLSTTAYPVSPTEVRSFFSDDSSQVRGHNSLRKRISNMRARLPNPYAARSASQSCDNIAWRSRMAESPVNLEHPEPDSNGIQEDDYGMPLAELRPTKLRSKVSLWFKEARVAWRRRLRERNSDERLCIPIHR